LFGVKFPVTVKRLIDGSWLAKSTGTIAGNVERSGANREEALERIQAELRYRIEWCPCSGVTEEFVELEVTDESPSRWRSSVF
jgi:hypothetical protein